LREAEPTINAFPFFPFSISPPISRFLRAHYRRHPYPAGVLRPKENCYDFAWNFVGLALVYRNVAMDSRHLAVFSPHLTEELP